MVRPIPRLLSQSGDTKSTDGSQAIPQYRIVFCAAQETFRAACNLSAPPVEPEDKGGDGLIGDAEYPHCLVSETEFARQRIDQFAPRQPRRDRLRLT
jgi:hypothetical protein